MKLQIVYIIRVSPEREALGGQASVFFEFVERFEVWIQILGSLTSPLRLDSVNYCSVEKLSGEGAPAMERFTKVLHSISGVLYITVVYLFNM